MFEYCAIVRSVYDGDTIRADIDLGFGIWQMNQPIRVYGIDTPEMKTSEGRIARDYAKALLDGKTVVMRTIRDTKEKYGRYLAKIEVPDCGDYAETMIALGHAKTYYGGTKEP